MLPMDIVAMIAEFEGTRSLYVAISASCRGYHWIPENRTSYANMVRTLGVWRLDTTHTITRANPLSPWILQWEPAPVPDYMRPTCMTSAGALYYNLKCKGIDREGYYSVTYKNSAGGEIYIRGGRHCCNGDLMTCNHSSTLTLYYIIITDGFKQSSLSYNLIGWDRRKLQRVR